MLAIIGGSGLTTLSNLDVSHREVVRTPFGEPSGALVFGQICGHAAVFLPRHGYGHTIAPHAVNYRANIWALHAQKVSHVVSVATVGGIHPELGPGCFCVPDQIIDYTHGRECTFAEYNGKQVSHQDFTWPYCEDMRQRCLQALERAAEPCLDAGVYAAVQGPRLETRAEIERLARDGADMVGMTGMPEAALARELGLPYAAINVVANHAAGRGSSANGIHFESLEPVLQSAMGRVRAIIEKLVGCQNNCPPIGMSV